MKGIVACCLVVLLGCSSDPKITGVRILARFDASAGLTQLGFGWQVAGEAFAGPLWRPQDPGQPLTSPQDLVVYLDDRFAGRGLECRVEGRLVPLRGSQTVPLRLHEIVPCVVMLGPDDGGLAFPDAGAVDGAPAGTTDGPGGSGSVDGPPGHAAFDLAGGEGPSETSRDGAAIDLNMSDLAVPDAPALPPDVVAPAPDGPALAPDSPVLAPDSNVAPPDAPLPLDVAPPSNGCATGARKAFANTAEFPTVAGCGSAEVSYSQALSSAGAVCATGWHWCGPAELRALPASPAPAQVSGTCGWLDSRQATCTEQQTSYGKADCQGLSTQTSSAGAGTAGACTLVDLTCTSPWKYAVMLQSWATSSLSDPGGCINHVGFACGGTIGNATCWVVCCKD
jgi:hypothetical protein